MRIRLLLCFTLLALLAASITFCAAQSVPSAYNSVQPIIGTDGGGNTFPGASLPFGMMQWSPDTNTDAWYYHKQDKVYGFSLTHLSGAGCSLYGDFAILPTTAELATSPGAEGGAGFAPYAEAIDHMHEDAHPGYYAVALANGIHAEIAVAERAGIARFVFPAGADARVLINAGSSANTIEKPGHHQRGSESYGNQIHVRADGSFTGWVSAGGFCSSDSNYKLYVYGHFETPQHTVRLWQDDAILPSGDAAKGKHTGAWLDFGQQREVMLRVGISYVSVEGARANLEKEIPDWDFGKVWAQARNTWQTLLDRVTVEGGTPEERTIFYTGVYHSLLAPMLFSDEDGRYIGFDDKVHTVAGSQKAQYANFSDWDIYRNTVQFQALLNPERESDMAQSLVNDAAESGWYPRWPAANDVTYVMGGDSPVIVIASSYAFGAHSFDTATALKYMVKAGTEPGYGPHHGQERPFVAEYLKLGYVPAEKDSIDASRTLEYTNDDFAIAQFARATGNTGVYDEFLKRSENWKNLLDPTTHWIRPRNSDGTWLKGFDAEKSLPKRPGAPVSTDQYGFEEGNTYQYSFMLPYAYPELFRAMGGAKAVEPRLNKFFSKLICWGEPCFNMANEPDFVTPYAYVFLGMPWKTEDVVTRIAQQTFNDRADGIPGNDDLGATSGVYVWNALGLYPAVPGVGGLVLGTPMFDRERLEFAGGRTLEVTRKGSGIYVQSVRFNGAPYASTWLPLAALHTGVNRMEFTMGTEPNTERGTAVADRPPNFE
ncbi:MAG TPA: GH92 family glycosyl hydrolase [Terracidiphilus sp.]|nr:GH92 family glycosyl hydrolase [Terracidiphilus sp.]